MWSSRLVPCPVDPPPPSRESPFFLPFLPPSSSSFEKGEKEGDKEDAAGSKRSEVEQDDRDDLRVLCEACQDGKRILVRLEGGKGLRETKGIVHAVVSVLDDLHFSIERATVGTNQGGDVEDDFVCLPPKRKSPVQASDLKTLIEARLSLVSSSHQREGEVAGTPTVDGVVLKTRLCSTSESEVWRADWDRTSVAVKIVKQDVSLVREELSFFRQIRHPHVITFYGLCSFEGGRSGIVMQLCACSLHERIHERERKQFPPSLSLTPSSKLRWLTELASALCHVHARDIVHRDVKPPNVLLDVAGKVRLSDFGLARLTSGAMHLTGETGTYRYMAPEVVKSQEYGSPCDVFSYGMTGWELLFERYPFDHLSPIQTAFAIAKGERPPPSRPRHQRRDRRLYDLETTLFPLCWEQDPSLRCSSRHAKEMLFRLRW